MIDRDHKLPVSRQCALLCVARSTAYYQPQERSQDDLGIMRQIDELHLRYPFAGSRMLRDWLCRDGFDVGRRHVRTLMRRMGIQAIYRRPRTSIPTPKATIYPYLHKDVFIEKPNHVWATDITYIPLAKGFGYLVAILDLATRRVLAWRVSNTMDTDFCIEALKEAITRYGAPQIFNTDQGSQFTSKEFTDVLKAHHIQISMDGKGRWIDNVFVERLWRSVKYEDVYLHAYGTLHEVKDGLTAYFQFYNQTRPHRSLDGKTPDEVYFAKEPSNNNLNTWHDAHTMRTWIKCD
jgi:putative transposase